MRFFQKALCSSAHPRPTVINMEYKLSYPKVITELKQVGKLGRCRPAHRLKGVPLHSGLQQIPTAYMVTGRNACSALQFGFG